MKKEIKATSILSEYELKRKKEDLLIKQYMPKILKIFKGKSPDELEYVCQAAVYESRKRAIL